MEHPCDTRLGPPVKTPAMGSASAALIDDMVKANFAALHRTAVGLTGGREDAEDLLQDTFLNAWRSVHTFRPGTDARAWLFRILRNAHIDRYRASTRAVPVVAALDREDPAFAIDEPSESIVAGAVMEADVRNALLGLPAVFRSCVVLADLQGLSRQEIADALGIPRGTVLSRLSRGRRAMRKALAGYGRAQAGASSH